MRAVTPAIVAMLVSLGTVLAQGQDGLPPAPAPAPPGPVLRVADTPDARPVPVASARLHVVINGPLSETTLTLTFRNDEDRVLEGELTFPLPDGATVGGFGLDVDGVIVDAVAVEKQKARVSYETEVRKGIDPGLVEHVSGNVFRTRVYPIPAKGTRTVRVRYVSHLAAGRDGGEAFAPVGWPGKLPECAVRVEVVEADAGVAAGVAPLLRGAPEHARLEKAGDRLVAEWTAKDVALDQFSVTVPAAPARRTLVERRPHKLRTADDVEWLNAGNPPDPDEHYFLIQDAPARAPRRQPQPVVERIGVLWDASLSREKADPARELRLLAGLLGRLKDVRVDVTVFRNTPDAPVSFDVRGGDATAVVEHLRNVVYDGGTNLGAAVQALADAGEGKPARSYVVLFSDGVSNLGPDGGPRVDVPVYALSGAPTANHAALRRLARESGGAHINLAAVASDEKALPDADAAVLDRLGDEPFALVSAEFDENQVADLLPRAGEPIAGRLLVTGRLLAPEATVKLNYGHGKRVTHSVTFTLRQADAVQTGLVPRFWAQQLVADLSASPERHDERLLTLGREFAMVTPNTSLLVLETAEQYVEHRIVPPKSRPEVYARFMEQIEHRQAEVARTREERVQRVLAMWDERVKWWEATYEYPEGFAWTPPKADGATEGRVFGNGGRGRGGRATTRARRVDAPAPQDAAGEPTATGATPDRELRDSLNRAEAPAQEESPGTPTPRAGAEESDGEDRVVQAQVARPEMREAEARFDEGFLVGGSGGAVGGEGDGRGQALGARGPVVQIQPWDPNTPYLQAMKHAGPAGAYAAYLDHRETFGTSPAFYLDSADYLLRNDRRDEGLRVLTSVAELHLEDARLMRVVAHRLAQVGETDLALALFQRILALRPEEPQSHRDLALAFADRAAATFEADPIEGTRPAVSDYERALELLHDVVMGDWDRFEGVEVVALMEANAIIDHIYEILPRHEGFMNELDPRLVKTLELDVRIVLTWDADLTDVDLWVTEPSGETCKYDHNRTTIGGLLSKDFTRGYGPEEYCLRRLMPGQYKIQANFYGSGLQQIAGPTTVQATVITHFGRPDEKRESMTLRLTTDKEVVDIGTITLGDAAAAIPGKPAKP